MGSLVVMLVLATTPPLVPIDDVPRAPLPLPDTLIAPPVPGKPVRTKPPLPDARFALWFAPLSLFGLVVSAEPELHLAAGVSVFFNVGGGPLGQLLGDVGARYAIDGKPFEGFYLDARASIFTLPAGGMVLLGPGMQIGHAWRTRYLALSVALGFTTWVGVARMQPGAFFFTGPPSDEQVILLPGVTQPPPGIPAVQPALRFSFGPTF